MFVLRNLFAWVCLSVMLAACGGGGGSGASSTVVAGNPPDVYAAQSNPVIDTGAPFSLTDSDFHGISFPMHLAGVKTVDGKLQTVYGGADVTVVDALTVDVTLAGQTTRYTRPGTQFASFTSTGGQHTARQSLPFVFTIDALDETEAFDLMGGLQAGSLPTSGTARFTGTAQIYMVDDSGQRAASSIGSYGVADLTADFVNGRLTGEVFDGDVLLGGVVQDVEISIAGDGAVITGVGFGAVALDATTDAVGGSLTLTDADVTGTIMGNGGDALVGIFGAEYENVVAGQTLTGTLVGDFNPLKNFAD